MLNEENFKETLLDIVDNPDNYTKDELYEAFLDMTERFLDELANTLTLEKSIISKCGEEKGQKLIGYIASSNSALSELEQKYLFDRNQKAYIRDMLTYTESEYGLIIADGNSDTD